MIFHSHFLLSKSEAANQLFPKSQTLCKISPKYKKGIQLQLFLLSYSMSEKISGCSIRLPSPSTACLRNPQKCWVSTIVKYCETCRSTNINANAFHVKINLVSFSENRVQSFFFMSNFFVHSVSNYTQTLHWKKHACLALSLGCLSEGRRFVSIISLQQIVALIREGSGYQIG